MKLEEEKLQTDLVKEILKEVNLLSFLDIWCHFLNKSFP